MRAQVFPSAERSTYCKDANICIKAYRCKCGRMKNVLSHSERERISDDCSSIFLAPADRFVYVCYVKRKRAKTV